MRRSSPAPRSFVLALLRALHPWPRLRFGAATPPPGKVHSTNQINRSPLTGGLRTDKGVAAQAVHLAARFQIRRARHLTGGRGPVLVGVLDQYRVGVERAVAAQHALH